VTSDVENSVGARTTASDGNGARGAAGDAASPRTNSYGESDASGLNSNASTNEPSQKGRLPSQSRCDRLARKLKRRERRRRSESPKSKWKNCSSLIAWDPTLAQWQADNKIFRRRVRITQLLYRRGYQTWNGYRRDNPCLKKTPVPDKPFNFIGLPAEIRDQILSIVLTSAHPRRDPPVHRLPKDQSSNPSDQRPASSGCSHLCSESQNET